MYKKCPKCKQIKDIKEFYKNKSKKDGLQSYCKKCMGNKTSKWNKAHPDIMRKSISEWKKRNPEKIKQYRRSIKTRISTTVRRSIWSSLKRKQEYSRLINILGYSIPDLMRHLEKQFKSGMTWENYGEWHIDHKIPIAAFNYASIQDIDFRKCWALNNLQPLWALENIKKHDRLIRSFQPSLKLQIGG